MSIEKFTSDNRQKRVKLTGKTARPQQKQHIVCVFIFTLNQSQSPSPNSLRKLQSFIDSKSAWIARIDDDTIDDVLIRTVYTCFPIGQGTSFQGKSFTDIVNIIGFSSPVSYRVYHTTNGKVAWKGTGSNGNSREKFATTQARKNHVEKRQTYRQNAKILDEMLADIMQSKRRQSIEIFDFLKSHERLDVIRKKLANGKKYIKDKEFYVEMHLNDIRPTLDDVKRNRLFSQLADIYSAIVKLDDDFQSDLIDEATANVKLKELDANAWQLEHYLSDKESRQFHQDSYADIIVPLRSQNHGHIEFPENFDKPVPTNWPVIEPYERWIDDNSHCPMMEEAFSFD